MAAMENRGQRLPLAALHRPIHYEPKQLCKLIQPKVETDFPKPRRIAQDQPSLESSVAQVEACYLVPLQKCRRARMRQIPNTVIADRHTIAQVSHVSHRYDTKEN
jgi:hypothetical protein